MYAKHYHLYKPSVATNILDTFKKFGWTPPSEDPAIQAKWEYYKNCEWNKAGENQND